MVISQVTGPGDFLELQRHPQWFEAERNAKRFAAAILMPPTKVLEFARWLYPQLVAVAGFGNVDAILKHIKARGVEKFEVSPTAMEIRLKESRVDVVNKVTNAMRDGLDYF